MTEGKFICIEGPDGAGSSTHARLLKQDLEKKGEKVLHTKEPTDNIVGGLIRGLLTNQWRLDQYGLQLLFSADRAHHLAREIEPTLEKGWLVLTDRYIPSTIAYGAAAISRYEGLKGEGKGYDYWWQLLSRINDPFRKPDLTMLIDLDPRICVDRIREGRPSAELFETEDTLRKVVEGYKRYASENQNVVLIGGNGSIEDVHGRILETIEDKLYEYFHSPGEDDIPF